MPKRIKKKLSGFTLIEIVVVLFIVSIGIFGVMSLIMQNIESQSYDKNTLIASQLAQEGIELIRQIRGSNWRDGVAFDSNLVQGKYYMDYLNQMPEDYSGNPTELVLKQNDKGYYVNYDNLYAVKSTIFSRLITIKKLNSWSLQVNSKVTWRTHGRSHTYNLETLLYDWK